MPAECRRLLDTLLGGADHDSGHTEQQRVLGENLFRVMKLGFASRSEGLTRRAANSHPILKPRARTLNPLIPSDAVLLADLVGR